MYAALAAQQAQQLDAAEQLYRKALELDQSAADALHMLGVIRYEKRDYVEARTLIERALDLTNWAHSNYRHNFALVIARANDPRRGRYRSTQEARYRERKTMGRPFAARGELAVGIVIPAYNHERYIGAALRSILDQTYRKLEVVVIDDGSSDRTAEIAASLLVSAPFPTRVIRRENRGAAYTINEGISLLKTPYVNILNSDDMFHSRRIELLVNAVVGDEPGWGFSGVEFIDEVGSEVDALADRRAYGLACAIGELPLRPSIGFALLASNVAVSSGNIFFARKLWEEVGGFRDLRYNHDWDFALRLLWLAEPEYVDLPLYRYRMHSQNTIGESGGGQRIEANQLLENYISLATGAQAAPNRFAPAAGTWGRQFAIALLETGAADALEPAAFRQLIFLAEMG